MLKSSYVWVPAVLLAIGCAPHGGSLGAGDGGGGDGGNLAGSDGPTSTVFDVEPSTLQTIKVTRGTMTPGVAYTATLGGQPISITWTVDRGDVGSIPAVAADHATMTPTGTTGGMITVRATYGATTLDRQVFVQLDAGTQNGADTNNADEQHQIPANVAALLGGGGGVGGVGGEGLGGPVSDPATMTALGAPTSNGGPQSLVFLYPYDATVWPRGMLAPLLMWSWMQNDADAVQINLSTTSGSFTWTGSFAKPAILTPAAGTPSNGAFIRHPIPQDIWTIATNTAGGTTPDGKEDKLTVKLTIAKGGLGFGPISETWSIAPARLTGTVYYNSYGTSFVKNWNGQHDTANHPIGAAILGVRSGDLSPHLVVGTDSPIGGNGLPTSDIGCRVCHIVSSRGRWIIAQAENQPSYLYDLTAADVQGSSQHLMPDGDHAWAAMLSDGSYALTNAIDPSSTNDAIGPATSKLYNYGSPAGSVVTTLPIVGLPAGVAAGYPGYSPDDKFVAYIDATGHTGDISGPLTIAAYDVMTKAFSNVQTLVTPMMGQRVGYPAFLPDNSGIIYETEVRTSVSDTVMVTRNSARSELSWVNTIGTPTPTPLATLNGKNASGVYLPSLPAGMNNHGSLGSNAGGEASFDDTTLDYEPTVLPIIAGHYAWVVFTSRRLYGNELTTDPWASNPTQYDLTKIEQGPTKKLWVAAIDLNAPPGSDPSHPAFYLPAQEITAGNSRGFWVLDPCKVDGMSCESGDQCCNGYCEPDPTSGSLVCTNMVVCAAVQEKCVTASDCCDTSNSCINGFCAAATPIL